MTALEKRFRCDARQDPGQLRDLRHVALPKERPPLHVQTAREKIQRDPPAVAVERLRIVNRRQRMIIGDEIKRLVLLGFLKGNGRPHHPEIISDVENAGGLNAGKNAHNGELPRGSATQLGMTNGNGSPIPSVPRRMRRVQRKVALISSLFLASCLTFALGQGPAPSPMLTPAPVLQPPAPMPELALAHELTKPDLEAFLDALIPAQLQNRDIAGAVVVVVKDGQTLLAKGYGYADFAAKKPVVAEKTLFRPGSISKVFTAIAVMQLVEQGKL